MQSSVLGPELQTTYEGFGFVVRPQRSQFPLIQEYTLNHNTKAPII